MIDADIWYNCDKSFEYPYYRDKECGNKCHVTNVRAAKKLYMSSSK